MSIVKVKRLICACLFLLTPVSIMPATAAVYIGAHPDDIELFMGRNASVDVYTNNPTVFIVVTAGDAGNVASTGPNAAGIPYYRARLKAHESAVRFWKGLNGPYVPNTTYSNEVVGGKTIEKASFGNIVMYNLNLPDQGPVGISHLINGTVSRLSDVQGVNNYSLSELVQTIRLLIANNNKSKPNVWVNLPEPSASANPNDHVDHVATGNLVLLATNSAPYNCVNKAFYWGYNIASLPENLSAEEKNVHVGTWGVVNASLMQNGNPNTWDPTHNSWLGRIYYTTQSGGTCNF